MVLMHMRRVWGLLAAVHLTGTAIAQSSDSGSSTVTTTTTVPSVSTTPSPTVPSGKAASLYKNSCLS